MLAIESAAASSHELEQDVDETIDRFNDWYRTIQDPAEGVTVGLVPAERAVIKTFLGYFLGVGGHYPPKEAEKNG